MHPKYIKVVVIILESVIRLFTRGHYRSLEVKICGKVVQISSWLVGGLLLKAHRHSLLYLPLATRSTILSKKISDGELELVD